LAIYLYENNIPTPREFWIPHVYTIPSHFYNISDAQFESLVPYKITRNDYLLSIVNSSAQTDELRIAKEALCFQPKDKLFEFASRHPGNYKYFPTKRGVLRFLINRANLTLEDLQKFLIPLCTYQNREKLIARYQGYNIFVYYNPTTPIQTTLYFPPYWFEKAIFQDRIIVNSPALMKIEIAKSFVDDDLQPVSRQKIWDLIQNRDSELIYYSNNLILRSSGWYHTTNFDRYRYEPNNWKLIEYIKQNPTIFSLVDQPNLCANRRDIYFEEYQGFVITYGNYLNFECYSPEDLEAAFIVEPNRIFFRNPLHPAQVFTLRQLLELSTLLRDQNPNDLPNYRDRIRPLIDKMIRGLNSNNLTNVREKLRGLTGPDREHTIELLEALFRAGMYQRTWKGPTFGYPMRTIETRGSCQKDIEKKMTPELAKIQEEYDLLTDKSIVNQLNLLYSTNTIYPQFLMEFVAETAQGNYCVGGGSTLMIETAYNYLTTMNVIIPNFDYNTFENLSTHR
jgi:hypothetical protein